MLRVEKLNQFYGSSHCLKDISFELPANTCLAILGLNGAGKSTLAKSLIGINPIANGSIQIAGTEISDDIQSESSFGIGIRSTGQRNIQ